MVVIRGAHANQSGPEQLAIVLYPPRSVSIPSGSVSVQFNFLPKACGHIIICFSWINIIFITNFYIFVTYLKYKNNSHIT